MEFQGYLVRLNSEEAKAVWNVLPEERPRLQLQDGETYAMCLQAVLEDNFPDRETAPEPFKSMLGQLAANRAANE